MKVNFSLRLARKLSGAFSSTIIAKFVKNFL